MKTRLSGLFFTAIFALFASGCGSKAPQPTYDVPSLIGQPIDVVTQKLGAPQPGSDAAAPSGTWKNGDVSLNATWKAQSQRVTGWTLMSRDNAHALREEERAQLLVPGMLKENDPRYSLEWVEDTERPLFYTGVKVIPAPKTHKVTIRATGSEAMIQVSYAAGSASETFHTIAPWDKSFDLPDDAQITFSAQLYKRLDAAPFRLKVEILADEKVVANADQTAGAAQCEWVL